MKKIDELLKILSDSQKPVPSSSLAKVLGVTERTVRNYVNKINENEIKIVSSKHGYYLYKNTNFYPESDSKLNENSERSYLILSKLLISKEGVSLFDEAENLDISESTIANNVIPRIKKLVSKFNLKIESKNYLYFLVGEEKNKRKLIGYLVSNHTYGCFSTADSLKRLFPSFDVENVLKNLYDLCQESDLFLNTFALNNLLIHLLIIIIRLDSKDNLTTLDKNHNLDSLIPNKTQKDKILNLAKKISILIQEKTNRNIPEDDYQQIVILISLSIEKESTNLQTFIDKAFIKNIEDLVQDLSKRYSIPSFDKDFVLQFSLHMYNARQRSSLNISYPNPITYQIKKDYAPIYDMAVFFSHQFSRIYQIDLSEDEIAFIAFHFGSYLENNKQIKSKISCIVVIENYHDISKNLINELNASFSYEVVIIDVMSLNRYTLFKPECDLLITCVPTSIQHPHKVFINPILTKKNMLKILSTVEEIEKERKIKNSKDFLRALFDPKLYFRNVNLQSKNSYIQFMGEKALENHYINEKFIQDVILRENVSSTAFTDYIAIPHTISQYAEKSFICVIHNDHPIKWGDKEINFILMIGISESDMKFFKDAFDLLIEVFYSTEKTLEILNTKNYKDFLYKICDI